MKDIEYIDIKSSTELPHRKGIGIDVKKLHPDAIIPTKANKTDAGWDLYAVEDARLTAHTRATVKTGIAIQMPDNYVGLIWPRSGLSVKKGIDVLAGVIDAGYRGEIMVCLLNTNRRTEDFYGEAFGDVVIKKGDKIAQIIFQKLEPTFMNEVKELSDTERGEKGFGSSGN